MFSEFSFAFKYQKEKKKENGFLFKRIPWETKNYVLGTIIISPP